jgi:hypothetical protein
VIAYKFLIAGRVAPFSGYEWPGPTGDAPGGWVEAAAVDPCRSGVHACRVEHLPIWIERELWRVELEGDVVEQDTLVVAPRGRLLDRVADWSGVADVEFTELSCRRTREHASRASIDLGPFLVEAAWAVEHCRPAYAGYVAARTRMFADGERGWDAERSWQATWIAERLGL